MTVRIDKWLQVACIFKTRTRATRACQQGRIRINGRTVPAHRPVRPGDEVQVKLGPWTRILLVKQLANKSVSKARARELYDDNSPPPPRLDPLERILRSPPEEREAGSGRPTKKDRRAIERLKRKRKERE